MNNSNNAENSTAEDAPDFGLEMQAPWCDRLLKGEKTIEVRSYPLPSSLIGTKMYIIETQEGTAGVSALADRIKLYHLCIAAGDDAGANSCNKFPRIIGWCKFHAIKEYRSQKEFEADGSYHLVSSGSGYAWKPGVTNILYGWVAHEVEYYKTLKQENNLHKSDNFDFAIRQKRSIFQLH
jgi:hypothetical protein